MDRNKSELTHKITDATSEWLDSHGFKPVETEVWMPAVEGCEKGWIADLAALIEPTQTELIELKLVKRRPPYRYPDNSAAIAWGETTRPLLRRMTCLVEVKATRADFLGDRKWNLTPPSDLALLAVPAGLISAEEYPEGWGILELRGDRMVRVKTPAVRQTTLEQQYAITYEIAIRRDHRTRYAEHREYQRTDRIRRAEDKAHHNISSLIGAVEDLTTGKLKWSGEPFTSVRQVLDMHGLHKMRERHVERLAKVFNLPAEKPAV